jgi:hypothetical protein
MPTPAEFRRGFCFSQAAQARGETARAAARPAIRGDRLVTGVSQSGENRDANPFVALNLDDFVGRFCLNRFARLRLFRNLNAPRL